MNIIKLSAYGLILTGREFGKNVTRELLDKGGFPFTLDFAGVLSMGSSFGDELLPALAGKQENSIDVLNANLAIKDCIGEIVKETKINVKFK